MDRATLAANIGDKALYAFVWGGRWHIVQNVKGRGFVAACDTTKAVMDRGVHPAVDTVGLVPKSWCACSQCGLRFARAMKGQKDFDTIDDYENELNALVDEDIANGKVPNPRVHARQTRGV